MGYVYIKKKSAVRRRLNKQTNKHLSRILLSIGILALLSVVLPVLNFQLFYSGRFKETISPLSTAYYNQSDENISKLATDYTQLSSWFVDNNNSSVSNSKELLGETNNQKYTISIPKLGIKDAVVMIGSLDLKNSLIQYPQTALPGEKGNAVIFGHSVLPQFFNPKSYLTIFSTLFKMVIGDKILVHFDNIVYTYQIEDMYEIKATDFSVLDQRYDGSYLSLITCSPPGTYLRRLVIKAKIVDWIVIIVHEFSRYWLRYQTHRPRYCR